MGKRPLRNDAQADQKDGEDDQHQRVCRVWGDRQRAVLLEGPRGGARQTPGAAAAGQRRAIRQQCTATCPHGPMATRAHRSATPGGAAERAPRTRHQGPGPRQQQVSHNAACNRRTCASFEVRVFPRLKAAASVRVAQRGVVSWCAVEARGTGGVKRATYTRGRRTTSEDAPTAMLQKQNCTSPSSRNFDGLLPPMATCQRQSQTPILDALRFVRPRRAERQPCPLSSTREASQRSSFSDGVVGACGHAEGILLTRVQGLLRAQHRGVSCRAAL